MPETTSAPTELRVSADRRTLRVFWPEERRDELPAEMLRVMSPSAEVQGHAPEQRVVLGGKRDVLIRDVRPIGHYAVRIVFDDGHDSGLFTWRYLADLGREKEPRWETHLAELAERGLSR